MNPRGLCWFFNKRHGEHWSITVVPARGEGESTGGKNTGVRRQAGRPGLAKET